MTGITQPFDVLRSPLAGRNLVEANAGTGKTYTIEGIFLRLLLEKELTVDQILVVTFTEAATAELRDRIRNKLHLAWQGFESRSSSDKLVSGLIDTTREPQRAAKRLQRALAQFDEAAVYTIHGFCQRELIENAFESGSRFDSELIRDQQELIREIAEDFWRRQLQTDDVHRIAYLLDQFKGPETLLQAFKTIRSRPISRTLPEIDPQTGLADLWAPAARLFSELKHLWSTEKASLAELLISHEGLNHRVYSRRNVPNWMDGLDEYLAAGNPYFLPAPLYRFSSGTIAENLKTDREPPSHELFDICRDLNRVLRLIPIVFKKRFLEDIESELQARKQDRNRLSFDDLLENLRRALRGPGGEALVGRIRSRRKVALIDEFQDTDPVQFEIFDTIFRVTDLPLFFIGDPKQSIYSFRGADIFAYLRARRTSESPYTLQTNWRSDGDLIRAVNTIFSFHDHPFLFPEISYFESQGAAENPARGLLIDGEPDVPFHLWRVDSEGKPLSKPEARSRVARAVANEIVRLLNLGREGRAVLETSRDGVTEQLPLAPEHIAVLVRSHHEGDTVQAALARLSVPSVVNSHDSVFGSPEFKEVVELLQAIADPRSEKKIKRALTSSLMQIDGETLYSWLNDGNRWEEVLEKFQAFHNCWQKDGFFAMMRAFIRRENIRTRLLLQAGGERRLTNFLHCLELFHETQNSNRFGMSGLLKWGERQLADPAHAEDETEIRLETDDRAVRILTIHASKGLEFPVVFCPFAWGSGSVKQVFFHDESSDHAYTLDLGSDHIADNRERAKREALAEEIRLLYVALTRARNRCTMVWGSINDTADSAPSWLFHGGKPKPEQIREDLQRLVERSDGHIRCQPPPETEVGPFAGIPESGADLRALEFTGSTAADWGIASFTALSRSTAGNVETPDRDRVRQTVATDMREMPAEKAQTMLTLPGGARTGNCFHEIFEKLDFRSADLEERRSLVQATLKRYDLDACWEETALGLIQNLLEMPLHTTVSSANSFSLGELDSQNRLSELEFYFPLQSISSADLDRLLQPHRHLPTADLLTQTLANLDFQTIPGFMKGFVDLVVQHDERYYIIDWKTNFLGSQLADYSPDRLQAYMIEHAFVLQYIIYTVALHRMLSLKLTDYDFSTHCGGVFYIFLRGIPDDPSQDTGIYRDGLQGCAELIESLSEYLGGRSGGNP